jgi:hypothetical protein
VTKLRKGYYPDDWEDRRKQVLKRDGYECQHCGASDTVLQAHHKTPISEGGGHELSNLETVCRSCHASEHPEKVAISIALENNQRLRMKYSSSSGTMVREIDPFGMDMHEGIQYLVGYDYYQEDIRIFRPTRIEWAHSQEESFDPPSNWDTEEYLVSEMGHQRTDDSPCFIATAAYGSPSEPDIDTLRQFRDDVLDSSRLTRWTIPVYYKLSPPVARWIRRSEKRQRYVRRLVVQPAVKAVRRFWNNA